MSETSLDNIFSNSAPEPEPAPAPVEAPAPAPQPTPEPAPAPVQEATGEPAASPAAPVEDDATKRDKGLQAALLAERRQRQQLEQRLSQLERPAQAQQANSQAPQREAFQSDAAFERALGRHEALQEFRAERQREAQEQEQQKQLKVVDDVIGKGKAKFADFDDVVNKGLGPFLTDELHQALFFSDNAHDLAYHLGKNPEEAFRISELPAPKQIRELALLEAKLSAPKAAAAQVAAQEVQIPQTLTQARDASGRFTPPAAEHTPLDDIFK